MNRKLLLLAVAVVVLLVWLFWPRREAAQAPQVEQHADAPAPLPQAAPRPAPAPAPAVAASAPAQAVPAVARAPEAADGGTAGGNAMFGPLVSLGQGYALSEALARNAAHADEQVDKLCSLGAKLREKPPMGAPEKTGLDAAEFMAPLIDYEKPLDQPPGKLHLSEELREHLVKGWPDWSQQITDGDLASLDFSWLRELQRYDHWSLLSAGRLKSFPMDDFFSTPIPNYVSLQQWAKLRFALARRRGDHAQASTEVRHLADLVRTQNILIAEAIAVALYKIDASARQGALSAGADVAGWVAPDASALQDERSVAFASMYFTFPGVKPETLKKAMGCVPVPCVALGEGAGANKAFGAFASSDNLQLILELAKANHCEQAIFDRAAATREVTAQLAWEQMGSDLDSQIPRLLGSAR